MPIFNKILLICLFTVHNSRDDPSNFGRHINLQLTYSFQHQNSAKSPALFAPHGKCPNFFF